MRRWSPFLLVLSGCSLVSDLDYSFGDAGVIQIDGGMDAGRADSGMPDQDGGPDSGPGPDGGSDAGMDGGGDAGVPGFDAGCMDEMCNDLDDDCDEMVDEALGTTSCGIGACARTVENCVAGVPQTCLSGSPMNETCNNADDDCDGVIDEELGSTTCGTGPCTRTVPNCMDGIPQTCTPGGGGPESCYNNADEDCDGLVDCADPDCGSSMCVPDSLTFSHATEMEGTPPACPPGYTPYMALSQNLDAPTDCTGCSCAASGCSATVRRYATGCSGTLSSLGSISNASCLDLGSVFGDPMAGLRVDGATGTASCTAAGTPMRPPASFTSTRTYCVTSSVGGGCTGGQVCVPRVTRPCALASGNASCPPGYPSPSNWYTGFTDGRGACSACSCTNNGCSQNFQVAFWNGPSCTGGAGSYGYNTDVCPFGSFPWTSASIIGSCSPRSTTGGSATPTGQHRVCCTGP